MARSKRTAAQSLDDEGQEDSGSRKSTRKQKAGRLGDPVGRKSTAGRSGDRSVDARERDDNNEEEEEEGEEEEEIPVSAGGELSRSSPKVPSHSTQWRQTARTAEADLKKYVKLSHDLVTFADSKVDTYGSDLGRFIRELDLLAKFPNPGYEMEWWRAEQLNNKKARGMTNPTTLDGIVSRLGQCSGAVDMAVVSCDEELEAHFSAATKLPVFISGASEYGRTLSKAGSHAIKDIQGFLDEVGPKKKISVQDLDKPKDPRQEHIVPDLWAVERVREAFLGGDRDKVINCLDLALPGYLVRHAPTALAELDMLRVSAQAAGSAGRGDELQHKSLEQFFLLSKRGSISATHVDAGGVSTWVQVLEGEKVWYYRHGLLHMSQPDRERFVRQGARDIHGYQQGWTKVHLRRGDIFIMLPGMNHAVYTSSDSLCVGGLILAAADVPNSLRIVRHLQLHPHLTNDDPPRQMFREYESFYTYCVQHGRVELSRMEDFLFALEDLATCKLPSEKECANLPPQEEVRWTQEWRRFTGQVLKGLMRDLRGRISSGSS